MPFLESLWQRVFVLAAASVFWLTAAAPLWAQDEEGRLGAEGAGPWVLPWILVLFVMGLGLMLVLRHSKRRDRPRSELFKQYEEEEDEE